MVDPTLQIRNILRWTAGCAGILVLGAVAIATFMAYFMGRVGPGGTVLDGFGRHIYEAPFMLRLAGIDTWRGLGWFLLDIAVFWVALGCGLALMAFGFGRR